MIALAWCSPLYVGVLAHVSRDASKFASFVLGTLSYWNLPSLLYVDVGNGTLLYVIIHGGAASTRKRGPSERGYSPAGAGAPVRGGCTL